MRISKTGKDLSVMVDSARRPSSRIERHRRHATIMQALPSLMELLGKESHQYPSSPTRINAVST